MPIYRDEQAKARAAREAMPPIVRDFYEAEYSTGHSTFGNTRNATPKWTFIGLRCKVCRRWHDEGHRPSCPVPKVERKLARLAVLESRKG